jgi:hypothetical protein
MAYIEIFGSGLGREKSVAKNHCKDACMEIG